MVTCPIRINITMPPTPTVTACAAYKSQHGIGIHATQAQAIQANVDYYAGIIDQPCAREIYNSISTGTGAAVITADGYNIANPYGGTGEYVPGMNIQFTIRWTNTGTAPGSFVPKATVNGQTIYGIGGNVSQTLQPGASVTVQFNFAVGTAGTFDVCPDPN